MLTRVQTTEPYDTVMRLAIHLPNGQTLYRCPHHGPMWGKAVQAPQHPCPYCFVMFFLKLEAVTSPHEREELMDTLLRESLAVEKLTERGDFDLEVWPHPKVEIVLDPSDVDYFKNKETS